jgi:uncharacterized protein (DUF433 family)
MGGRTVLPLRPAVIDWVLDLWHPLHMATSFEQAQSAVAALPRRDRARLFMWMAADTTDQLPGIEFDPRICDGSARIAGTRITVWSLESWRRLGAPDEEILRNYPTLQASDLLNAWQYVDRHRQEIDREIQENHAED